MSLLRVTIIDVGCGDSILLESVDSGGARQFALIDSNDTVRLRSSQIFLRRHFEKLGIDPQDKPLFEFVLLTHEHADHGQGLKTLMREFGTRRFLYPKSVSFGGLAHLLRFAQRSGSVLHHESVDTRKILPDLGEATLEILWPPPDTIDPDPNENSVVLLVRLGRIAIILSGDAEEKVWGRIAGRIPPDTRFFKVPHHGSRNGTFDSHGGTPWLDHCPLDTVLGISTHVTPHGLPDADVMGVFAKRAFSVLRTDLHHHLCFETNGRNADFIYSH